MKILPFFIVKFLRRSFCLSFRLGRNLSEAVFIQISRDISWIGYYIHCKGNLPYSASVRRMPDQQE